jgi:hypothetical protein
MRPILLFALLLTACSRQPAEPSLSTGTFSGNGRDRQCIAGEPGNYRAGLIAFSDDDANCTAAGRLERTDAGWSLVPKGEGDCRIPMVIEGNSLRIGQTPAACSYYCGPGASLAGKSYNRSDMGAKATDLAGDPLC